MSMNNLQALISDLHDSFSDQKSSPQQQQLMHQLQQLSHNLDEEEPIPPSFSETAEVLLEDIKDHYPASAKIIREVIQILANIGI